MHTPFELFCRHPVLLKPRAGQEELFALPAGARHMHDDARVDAKEECARAVGRAGQWRSATVQWQVSDLIAASGRSGGMRKCQLSVRFRLSWTC